MNKNNNDQGSGSNIKRWFCLFVPLLIFVLVNLFSPEMLSTILQAYQTPDSERQKSRSSGSQPTRHSTLSSDEKRILEKITTKISSLGLPQKVPNTTGGIIHVGKTGGSTLTSVLRNGCHSFLKRPCHIVSNESIVSKTATYYHTPDWNLLAKEPHDYYIWTVRDPFARTVSAFLYEHPFNVYIRRHRYKEKVYNFSMRKLYPIFKRCFKTVNDFALALKNYYPRATHIKLLPAKTLKCEILANAMFQHKAEKLNQHLHYDFRLFRKPLANVSKDDEQDKALFAIRTEYLWHDWVTVNELLGQAPGTVFYNEGVRRRNTTNYVLPVNSTIGKTEREYLCKAIEPEYQAYFDLLSSAINLDQQDVGNMKDLARKNCPNLQILR